MSKRRPFHSGLIAIVLVCALSVPLVHAQSSRKPLSKDAVVQLLKGSVSPKRVGELAQQRGIDFQITPETETELRQAGANDELLAVLRTLAPKTATLIIQSTPGGARVYVDDEAQGTTSPDGRLRISTIAPGSHRVRLSVEGYKDYEQGVILVSGQTANVSADLQTSKPVSSHAGEAPKTDGGNSAASPVAFEVWHPHGSWNAHPGHGTLQVSQGRLEFREDGPHADAKHAFDITCSELKEAKVNTFLMGGGDGWFHIRFHSTTFSLASGNKEKSQLIVQAISSACGRQY